MITRFYGIVGFDTKTSTNFLYQTLISNKISQFVSVSNTDIQCIVKMFRINVQIVGYSKNQLV